MEGLAREAGLPFLTRDTVRPPSWLAAEGDSAVDEWLEIAAPQLGFGIDAVETPYLDVQSFLKRCGPAILRLHFAGSTAYLAVVGAGRWVRVLAPDMSRRRVSFESIRRALCMPLEAALLPDVERLVDRLTLSGRERAAAKRAILTEHLRGAHIEGCWLLRLPAGSSVWRNLRDLRLFSRLFVFLGAHTVDSLLLIASWAMIGRAVIDGRLDYGWLLAWALMLITRVPFQLIVGWLQGSIFLRVAGFFKRRLLAGSLSLRPEEVRNQGVGQMLGCVIESEALESLVLNGGLTGALSIVDIAAAVAVLAVAAEKPFLAVALVGWTGIIGVLARRQYRKRQIWTTERLKITGDLVEKMVGHRTRLAQESPAQWREAEDKALAHYLEVCRKMDRGVPPLTVIAPRCWLLLGLLALAPGFYSGNTDAVTLAISFGGILLAHVALGSLTQSLVYLGAASVAWEQVRLLFNGASRPESPGSPDLGMVCRRPDSNSASGVLLDVQELAFRHEGRAGQVLESCNLQIRHGDRILLEGPSGGGKSTFAAILAGLRQPQNGLVLFRGLDHQALGSRTWRRLIAAAPQFHENHVLSGTLAFNVLMGRRWPASPEDYVEAESLCREVGLGNLLDRMPAGIFQMVGETGWQLSHGERSRLFLARALLQGTDTLILDETFGALDPESLVEAMQCVFRRSPTLVLIAHP